MSDLAAGPAPVTDLLGIRNGYDAAASAWQAGPELAYRRFAVTLVDASPVPLAGRRVLDVGAGGGSVSSVLRAKGALAVAVDAAPAMLVAARVALPGLPVMAADAIGLPFPDRSFDGVVSGFCLNHLPEPHRLLVEAARVARPGAVVLASTFAAGDDHPARAAVDTAARDFGWEPPAWYQAHREWSTLSDTAVGLSALACRSGLERVAVRVQVVDTGLASAAELVRWRLGMAQLAPFVASLAAADRHRLASAAEASVGPVPQRLRRAVLVLSSQAPA